MSGIRSMGGLRHILAKNAVIRKLYWAELVADQIPFLPPRTHAVSLLGRTASGAYAASTFARTRKARWKLASAGALAAAASTFAITALRKKAVMRGRLVSSLAGFAENGAVSLIGKGISKRIGKA
jgi:uncharacterized membrane protein